MLNSLIKKYNVPAPRYTSYPTVPFWDVNTFTQSEFIERAKRCFEASNSLDGISLYIHLPFCESLCTFCACHKYITKRHEVEDPYISALLKEWILYLKSFEQKPVIKEIHLGGGTPSFFAASQLERLITGILKCASRAENFEFSFEGHPNNTTEEHLKTLYDLGFERVSFGVQDYSPKVQKAIHRIQPFKNVENVTKLAREIGYKSVSHDLVYGLPFQTMDDIVLSIEKTISLLPDRVAFYSYAHVPWIKGNGQRGFGDSDVPRDDEKRLLYEEGKRRLAEQGYYEIGMDHFTLIHDDLYRALEKGKLHRNFMGYTASKTQLLIGLGVSAISDTWDAFGQNEKSLKDYYAKLGSDELPIFRGHILTEEDLTIRRHILQLMCHFETNWESDAMRFSGLDEVLEELRVLENDGLITIEQTKLNVTPEGRAFIRNICMCFDLRLKARNPASRIFSLAI